MAQPGLTESSDIATMSSYLDLEDRSANSSGSGRGRGKGGRGGKSRGGGGGGRAESREVMISKALSKLLRHAAAEAGLSLDTEGFARVDQVLQYPRLKSLQATFEDIQHATTNNAKQRFSLKLITLPESDSPNPSQYLIRANQGHSIAISSEALLTPITVDGGNIPDTVVHGTYFAFYPAIIASGGLKVMGRNHIHFATGIPSPKADSSEPQVISGMRGDAELLVYVDIRKSMKGGIKWWKSENGVILTEGDEGLLSTKYWSKAVGRREDIGVLWENGKWVADLPEGVKGKVPFGKGRDGGRGGKGGRGTGRGDRKPRGDGNGKGRGKGMKELDASGGEEAQGVEVP